MNREEKAIYMKAYRVANKEKIKDQKRSYYEANKEVIAAKWRVYYENNREKIITNAKTYAEANKEKTAADKKASMYILRNSEGIGVYKAVYPSGVYIGSGQIYKRRRDHLGGHTAIGKKLNEKALSFEVLSLADTKEESLELEQLVINTLGLGTLLNEQNAFKGESLDS